MNHTVYLCLGVNLGDRTQQLSQARALIGAEIGQIRRASSIYQTQAWGLTAQPDYLNQILELSSGLSAGLLLQKCLDIEQRLGRVRQERWGARLMDIDLIGYDNLIVETPALQLPHPRLHLRRFVLLPLCELAPDWLHPVLNQTSQELLQKCPDQGEVRKFLS